MHLRALLAVLTGAGLALAAPAAAYAAPNPDAPNVAVVTVLFENNCDHTISVTVANITSKTATFTIIDQPTEYTVGSFALKTVGHVATVISQQGEPVVRVQLGANTSQMGSAPGGRAAGTWAAVGCFPTCTDAWAAGKAPLKKGTPLYDPKLDSDSDGTACEQDPRPKPPGAGNPPPPGGGNPAPVVNPQPPTQPPVPAAHEAAALPQTGPANVLMVVAAGLMLLLVGAVLMRPAARRRAARVQFRS